MGAGTTPRPPGVGSMKSWSTAGEGVKPIPSISDGGGCAGAIRAAGRGSERGDRSASSVRSSWFNMSSILQQDSRSSSSSRVELREASLRAAAPSSRSSRFVPSSMAAAVKIGRRGGALALLHRFVPYTHTPDDEALSSHPRTQLLDIVAAVVALCATLAYAAFTFRYLTSRPPIQEFSTFNADELAERVAVVGGRSLHLRDLAVDLVVGVQDFGQPSPGAALVRQTYMPQTAAILPGAAPKVPAKIPTPATSTRAPTPAPSTRSPRPRVVRAPPRRSWRLRPTAVNLNARAPASRHSCVTFRRTPRG